MRARSDAIYINGMLFPGQSRLQRPSGGSVDSLSFSSALLPALCFCDGCWTEEMHRYVAILCKDEDGGAAPTYSSALKEVGIDSWNNPPWDTRFENSEQFSRIILESVSGCSCPSTGDSICYETMAAIAVTSKRALKALAIAAELAQSTEPGLCKWSSGVGGSATPLF